jgi:translation initiation factor IF-3
VIQSGVQDLAMPRTGVATNARPAREVKMRAVRDPSRKTKRSSGLCFRGHEVAHLELGMPLLNKVREEVAPIAMVEADPKLVLALR